MPSMTEACSAADKYFPKESLEAALREAEYIEHVGYGVYRH